MSKQTAWILAFLLLVLGSCSHLPHVAKSESDSVVKLVTPLGGGRKSICSGVAVGKRLIATAAHCMRDGFTPEIYTHDAQVCEAASATVHASRDVALIRVSGCRLKKAEIGNAPQQGDTVSIVGHPLGQEWSLSSGVVSRILPNGTIQVDAAVNFGNSGGGVYDKYGRLIGIVSYLRTPSWFGTWSGLGYAVPVQHALDLK